MTAEGLASASPADRHLFTGRRLPSDGLAGIALSWLEIIHDTPSAWRVDGDDHGPSRLAIALLVALSSLHMPVPVSALYSA